MIKKCFICFFLVLEELDVLIIGNKNVIYGDFVVFEVKVISVDLFCWLFIW